MVNTLLSDGVFVTETKMLTENSSWGLSCSKWVNFGVVIKLFWRLNINLDNNLYRTFYTWSRLCTGMDDNLCVYSGG